MIYLRHTTMHIVPAQRDHSSPSANRAQGQQGQELQPRTRPPLPAAEAPRDQADSTTTSEGRTTDPPHSLSDSANTGNGNPSLQANPENAMRLIAQMSPKQHSQMMEQLHQPSPQHLPPQQPQLLQT